MTTVKLEKQLATQPAVHAFVIGVGDYPHLDGGTDKKPDAETWGLGQLAAAPQSAMAFAEWLASELHLPAGPDGPDRPLGSIELLISQAGKQAQFRDPKTKKKRNVDRATMEDVKSAFDAFFERASSHEQNVAVFYFSGHGFNKERDCLLLEGFDGKNKNPFDDVLDFEGFVRGMEMCLARQQIYFNDACRNQSPELRKKIGDHRGNPLIIATDPAPSDLPRDYAIVRATAFGQAAYALPEDAAQKKPRLTRFTAALLKVLRGAGCIELEKRWEVRAEDLVPAVKALLQHETAMTKVPEQLAKLGGELSGFALHVPERPIVTVVVTCEPETDAVFACASTTQPIEKHAIAEQTRVWEIELPLDREYEFVATFGDGIQPRKQASVTLPPLHKVKLQ